MAGVENAVREILEPLKTLRRGQAKVMGKQVQIDIAALIGGREATLFLVKFGVNEHRDLL
jgi:hypothetical protein